ncbi:MAG: DUF4112 domain-containing protein [Bacteroidota bacterium]
MAYTKKKERDLLDRFVTVMDSAVKIPGTNIRFGLDALIGLIPGLGDTFSFTISSVLMLIMARKGISVDIALKMVGNILVDYLVGTIPLLGDLFDVGFKANQRNLTLMKAYYERPTKKANSKWVLPVFAIALLLLFGLIVFIGSKVISGITSLLTT